MTIQKNTPHPVDIYVGTQVRNARTQVGTSQEGLAKHLGITFQQVQKYENGSNRIAPSRLHAIAQLFNRPITFFYPPLDMQNSEVLAQPIHEISSHEIKLIHELRSMPEDVRRATISLVKTTAKQF